jgi:SAM-dependent methyltransferase
MTFEPTQFYDDPDVSRAYLEGRAAADDGNATIEEPQVLAMLGALDGARILDVGCGDGRFAVRAEKDGAAGYHGVDGSRRMLNLARARSTWTAATWEEADLEQWCGPPASYDVVVSRMTMHYIAGLERLLSNIRAALRPQGRFVFSVEHPVVTCFDNGDFRQRVPDQWLVRDYFLSGRRTCHWLDQDVYKQHRTLSEYLRLLRAAGFSLRAIDEGEPDAQRFQDPEIYAGRRSIPMYLMVAAGPV